jgi:hypothetical protein
LPLTTRVIIEVSSVLAVSRLPHCGRELGPRGLPMDDPAAV